MRPTKGQVQFHGPQGVVPTSVCRRSIGLLAHEALVYGELSARENLRFFGSLYDVPDLEARAAQLLGEVGLSGEAQDRPARTYSRGMLQRLALARTLLHEPSLVLLDEPFTGLDAGGIAALGRTLARVQDSRRIVIVVSHDLGALDGLCDHVAVICRGQIRLDERRNAPFSAAELREQYETAVGA